MTYPRTTNAAVAPAPIAVPAYIVAYNRAYVEMTPEQAERILSALTLRVVTTIPPPDFHAAYSAAEYVLAE